jgi:predicted transcriptional regulator
MSTTITVRIDDALKQKLELLADATHRSKSFLATEALQRYIETESWQIAHIKDSLEKAKNGSFISGEDMDAWLASWGKSKVLRPPKVLKRPRK